ncbi:MAG: hypothetical protein KGO05_15240 [Chloroflexota bacterium]|nr:hypothetical protein [Chloroflexota bacterium]
MEERDERAAGVTRIGYAPITRVDAERREIELCATSEALDAHGTIFDYAASKAAFARWLGNVREMHERRAVGRRVAVRCDDEARRVFVRLRISRGAQDTWEKVLDGTLRGASIGARDVTWRRERRVIDGRSRWAQVATRYDLAELSLVDNPSNPDALGVTFVRDATPDVTLLDPLEADVADEPADATDAGETTPEEPQPERQPLHAATRALLAGCGCPRCEMALATLADEPLVDAEAATSDPLTRALAAGLRISAARMERMDATLREAVASMAALRERDAERAAPASATATAAEVVIAELRARLERLEAQPAPGGPAVRAVEKSLAGAAPLAGMAAPGDEFRALEALAGRLRDPQAQLAVAAEMIRLQQRGE